MGIHSNIYKYIQALKQQDAIDSGVIVEAEYVGTFQGGKSGDTKRMKYVYYDEINDVYYEGRGELVNYEKVDSYIGRKVKIHIDGRGHSIMVGEQPGVGVYLTLLIIFSIVFIALTIVLVVLYMKWILTSIRLRREPNNNAELSTNSDATESNKSINNEQSGDIMPNVECDSASTIIKKFTLKVHDIDLTEIDNPEIEDLKKAVSVLIKTIETFLVLECNVPVNTFTFIQATGFEDGKCHVEAQYKEGEILRMYGFDDMTETGLFDILRDFLLEKVPDISGWNHIGDY